jgi:hypothetical protein
MNMETISRRVLAEFDEMPGLALNVRQAARLFGLDPTFCQSLLDMLVDSAYLRQTRGGYVVRGDRVAA